MHISPFILALDPAFLDDKAATADDQFFAIAIMQAWYAMGSTHPNPPVGAVIVKDDQVISVGYTHPPGQKHAEKHAIHDAKKNLKGATLYVTLEPCSHVGRTPPCTNDIIGAGISRVVFGAIDVNPRVHGNGIKNLAMNGLVVEKIHNPFLQEMALSLVHPFTTWIEKKRPFVVVKIATSADGYFAKHRGTPSKITGPQADIVVHQLRRASDAIMVGANTARIDDPYLTARLGKEHHGTQPVSIVVSSDLNLPLHLKLFSKPSIIFTNLSVTDPRAQNFMQANIKVATICAREGKVDLSHVLLELGSLGFTSLLIEAGPVLFEQIVQWNLADEIWWFRSNKIFNSDGPFIDKIQNKIETNNYYLDQQQKIGDDEVLIFSPTF